MKDATTISLRIATKKALEDLRDNYNDEEGITWDCFFMQLVAYVKDVIDDDLEGY